jgi:hypothetical protein
MKIFNATGNGVCVNCNHAANDWATDNVRGWYEVIDEDEE